MLASPYDHNTQLVIAISFTTWPTLPCSSPTPWKFSPSTFERRDSRSSTWCVRDVRRFCWPGLKHLHTRRLLSPSPSTNSSTPGLSKQLDGGLTFGHALGGIITDILIQVVLPCLRRIPCLRTVLRLAIHYRNERFVHTRLSL